MTRSLIAALVILPAAFTASFWLSDYGDSHSSGCRYYFSRETVSDIPLSILMGYAVGVLSGKLWAQILKLLHAHKYTRWVHLLGIPLCFVINLFSISLLGRLFYKTLLWLETNGLSCYDNDGFDWKTSMFMIFGIPAAAITGVTVYLMNFWVEEEGP